MGSALLALGLAMGLLSLVGSLRCRVPVSVVRSTPGLALLATVGPVEDGLPAVVAAWLVAVRLPPRLAGSVALLALVVVAGVDAQLALPAELAPRPELVSPTLSVAAVVSLALPLYLVTMAAQHLVAIAVLTAQGYRPPVGALLVGTGGGSMAIAPLLGPTVNLAAITGALTAGPSAHPDLRRRWVAGASSGLAYLLLGLVAPVTSAVVVGADPRLVATAAGLALLGAFGGAASTALQDDRTRLAAVVTLLVSGSGVVAGPVGAAPLGLLAGAVLLLAGRRRASGAHRRRS